MSKLIRRLFLVGLVAIFAPFSQALHAQVNSNSSSVVMNATLVESLTIAATPANVNFTLVQGGTSTASAPVQIVSNWLVSPLHSTVKLYAWFATPTAALTDAAPTPNNIPSSSVMGQLATGAPTSYTAFTQSNTLGVANGGLLLYSQTLSLSNRASTRTDNLNLQINLASQGQLPAGSYTGTLNIQAQAL